ncbi:MAG: hypothetical protein ACJA1Z_003343, partial [Patiriisocius sp.]
MPYEKNITRFNGMLRHSGDWVQSLYFWELVF